MAGSVDDDVVAPRRVEEGLRGIDRDALVPLGLQGIEQEGEFESHAAALAAGPDLLRLAVGQRAGVMQDATHQGRLAVVDVADEDDAHRQAAGHGRETFLQRAAHI